MAESPSFAAPLAEELRERIRAAGSGDRTAIHALLTPHLRMMNGLAHRLVGPADREEVVQESICQALRSLRRLEHADALGTWFGQIVVRVALRRRRQQRLLARFGLGPKPAIDPEQIASHAAPADVLVELRAIYGALERLPERTRQALVLRRIEGCSLEETAALMRSSTASVKRWIAAAERSLGKAGGRARG